VTRLGLARLIVPALLVTTSCGPQKGIVELDWKVVDAQLNSIFPGGSQSDTCGLRGRGAAGTRAYDLRVRLRVLDSGCAADDTTAACEIASEIFDCDRARGALVDIPPSDNAYLMVVDAMVDLEDEDPYPILGACVAVPGPRLREVTAGHITDLSVYQLVAHAIDFDNPVANLLDLEACDAR